MTLSLFANGAPPYPTSDAPAFDWIVWGGCFALAAFLGGWAILNFDRPKRFILCCVALPSALALVAFASMFVMVQALKRGDEQFRQQQQEGERIERLKREAEERSQP